MTLDGVCVKIQITEYASSNITNDNSDKVNTNRFQM